jgi:threonine dehydrogenase-like Zn-dependent dehydrogenase
LYLPDILPTAWQAVEYAHIPRGGSVTVFGPGPVGQFCTPIAQHRGARVIGVDYVPERREMARAAASTVGTADPLNMLQLFDKGLKVAMGQAHVNCWVDDLMPLVSGDDPLGVEDLCTHRLPLQDAPHGYEIFQMEQDGAIKVVQQP